MFHRNRERLKHLPSPLPSPFPHPPQQLHPAFRLICSPTHLLLQLIKLTTVPYMLCQILNHHIQLANHQAQSQLTPEPPPSIIQPRSRSPSKSLWPFFITPSPPHPHRSRLSHSLASPSTRSLSRLSNRDPRSPASFTDPFHSRLSATLLFHDLLRQNPSDLVQLLVLLDRLLSHPAPPRLHYRTLDLLFFHTRTALVNQLLPTTLVPIVPASVAWKAEAMAQIVDRWRRVRCSTLRPSPRLSTPEEGVDREVLARRRLDRIEARRHAFLAAGPPTCDCQRPRMPPAPLRMDQVGSLDGSLLGRFVIRQARSLSTLTWLRLVDAARQARRWDIAVLCLDRVRLDATGPPRLQSRRLGQTTALLSFLRADGRRVPETDAQRLWCVHFVCESIEQGLAGASGEWAQVNRLTLDVLTRFASMPVGTHGRKMRAPTRLRRPLLDVSRHRRLLAAAATDDVLGFAVATRSRCQRLLSRLARPAMHPWAARSAPQLRLLEHLARQGTEQQFMALLARHLAHHGPGAKLARTVLVAARRFETLAAKEELVHECLAALAESADTRPAVDFLLRPAQSAATLERHLAICLGALPPQGPGRTAFYGHLLFRLSQLRSPMLAMRVWTQIDAERRRVRVRVGRRTRRRAGPVVRPSDKLSAQLVRSMVYVYRNLTRKKSAGPARGRWFKAMYARLALRASGRRRSWPVSRLDARKRLINQMVTDGVARLNGELWRALERAGVDREQVLRVPGAEQVVRKAVGLGRAGKRANDWLASRGGTREKWTREVGVGFSRLGEFVGGGSRNGNGKIGLGGMVGNQKGCSRYWARIVAEK